MSTINVNFSMSINHNEDDIEVEIDADYSPGFAGSWYRNNGDPGDPPESAEITINSIMGDNGEIDYDSLSSYTKNCIEEKVQEKGEENRYDF